MQTLTRQFLFSSSTIVATGRETGFYANGPETSDRLVFHRDLPKTILYVEDDLTDILLFNHAIEDAGDGMRLVAFRDPSDALLVCSHTDTPPDLVVLDINMPRLGGIELLRRMKKIPAFGDVPFVLLTTSPRQKYREDAETLGATHIVKPLLYEDYPGVAARILEIARQSPNG